VPSCFAAGNDRDDGWYSVTATSTATMTIDLTGDRAKTLAVWTACGGGTELGCHQTAAGGTSTVSFAATNGVTYYVQIHRNGGNNGADITGTICAYMAGGGGGGGSHTIGTGDLTACTGTIFDTGGAAAYGNSETITETYCSDVAGQCITITFSSFATESCCDDLTIYDGPNAGSPLIGVYQGTNSPGNVTGTSGCLTFVWSSDGSITGAGWEATISCAACPTCSDGIQNGTETGIDCGGTICPACPCAAAPIWNDEACCALPLTVNPGAACITVTAGTVQNATPSIENPGACFGTENDDVWFSFIATNTTHYVSLLNVAGSTTDMYHSLWTGPCNSSSLVAGTCSDGDSQTATGLTIGATYYVRVNTYGSTAGQTSTFDVCIGSPPPPPTNDEPCAATPAVVNPNAVCTSVTPGYTVGGTQTLAGCVGTANDDVWFSFVALDPNQNIEILNATGTTDMVHELFSGPCGSLTSLGCSDPNLSTYTGLTVGATYFVRVYTYSSTGANTGFDLCITSPCGIGGLPPTCGLNYSHSTTGYSPYNYNTGSAFTFSDDRFADAYTSIGFDFCFDGITYSDVLVSSNGYLIFPSCYSAAPAATAVTPGGASAWSIDFTLPNTNNAPRNAIMGAWQDIDPSVSGTIRSNVEGTAPNRVFVAKFDDVAMFSCNAMLFSGQIMLYETTNNIEVHMGEKTVCTGWNDGAAVLGLHNYDGTNIVIPAGYNYPTQWTVPVGNPEGHLFTNNCIICTVPLPIELVNFKATAEENDNLLSWTTVSEKNNDYFILEKSIGGAEFMAIGQIDGNGNSEEPINYSFRHSNPEARQYYRLRQVDFDGSAHYSDIILVSRLEDSGIEIFPNPSAGELQLSLENQLLSKVKMLTIHYIDIAGKRITEELKLNVTGNLYSLNKFDALNSGIYIIQVLNEDGEIIHLDKVVKQ
jgi:hypothetical protein